MRDEAARDDADEVDAGTPLWVKVSGVVALVVLVVIVALHLSGYSPGGHAP